MRTLLGTLITLGTLLGGRTACAAEGVDYLRDVKPLLAARRYACHGGLKQKAKLRVDTAELVRTGGSDGPAVVPGKSAESPLVERVLRTDKRRMPPASEGEALTEREVAILKKWIDQGATGPADEKPESDPKDHWAFHAPVRPPVPPVKDAAWVRNPIDAFIAAERDKLGVQPQPPADRPLLVRRVYLDLVGLPPTSAELATILSDPADDWYERLVDRLLASKQYGERWGRHWMDVWRYSDWWGLGLEVRNSQKHIWHWRDWIIESLNEDKGYDQMLREMLAADELYPDDLNRLRASGYLARHYFRFNRTTWLDQTIEHTAKAFLGLTVNCAKCHDHKYDPISQVDYYRLRAFFEPYQVRMDQLPGEINLEKDGLPRGFDCHLDAPTYRFVRGDDRNPVKDDPLTPGVPTMLALGELDIRTVTLPPTAYYPGLRPFVLEDHLRLADRQIATARVAHDEARRALAETALPTLVASAEAALQFAEKALSAAELQPAALRARAAADRARYQTPPAAEAPGLAQEAARAEAQAALAKAEEDLARADLEQLRAEPAKKAEAEKKRTAVLAVVAKAKKSLEAPGATYTPLRGAVKTPESPTETAAARSQPFPTTSSGRRSALAQWLTDPRHALTARVAVNHMWARHFGQPLVPTVFDFGRKGKAPTHPALLDYLAVELRENRWSMKHIHRLMVTSNTYRLASTSAGAAPANLTADAENRTYWHMNPVRMSAQVVRDSLLQLAGELDPTLGGPSIPVADETTRRRSLYYVHSHNDHQRFLSVFDDASVLECYRRAESIVPQQALALANSKLTLDMAAKIADRLKAPTDAEFVQMAFALILAGQPTAAEKAECEQALAAWTKLNPLRARANLVHALLNHNDFITIR